VLSALAQGITDASRIHVEAAFAQPLKLACGQTLRNRLAKAAMTEGLADPLGRPTEAHLRLYTLWSAGGCGLLITGNVMVDPEHLERPGNVIIGSRPDVEMFDRLCAWARAGTAAGTQLWMQISHSGRQTPRRVNPSPKAPSRVPLALPGRQYAMPQAMTGDEIEDVVHRFVLAAEVAKAAGFTGVQVHAAHGYLLSEFLSPRTNQRTDQWGGSLENRARLLRRVVRAVRVRCGNAFPVSVKLNSADFQRGGFAEEDALDVASWLAEDGVALLEISGGTYERPRMMGMAGTALAARAGLSRVSTRAREAYFLDFASRLRARTTLPLMVTGGFRTAAAMNNAIGIDGIDVVGLARPLVHDPLAARALLEGRSSELERWEWHLGDPAGLLGVNSPVRAVKAASSFAVMAWYYGQLFDHGEGRTPTSDPGIWRSLVQLRWREAAWLRARARLLGNGARPASVDTSTPAAPSLR
jgi:2,4-dienoyl-CoA reductase-like NADH-dependent reductase (Old Yellow Enzyme family)